MLNIALFGPPGAGKGTQSENLVKKYNLFYISTGDLLRKELTEKTKLGLEAKRVIASGGLVSDEIIVQIIEKTITENPEADGFLFDGFPRTYIQSYILDGLMLKLNTSLSCLISLEVHEETSVRRLLDRGKTSGRSDDNETVIRNRLREYKEKTLPVLNFYRDKGIYHASTATSRSRTWQPTSAPSSGTSSRSTSSTSSCSATPAPAAAPRAPHSPTSTASNSSPPVACSTRRSRPERPSGARSSRSTRAASWCPTRSWCSSSRRSWSGRGRSRGSSSRDSREPSCSPTSSTACSGSSGSSISRSIEIEVPTLELITRLDERSRTDRCMPYDNTTAKIVKRLAEHETKTVPVIEKYNKLHGVVKVDGIGRFEEVFERTSSVLESLFRAG